MKELVKNSVTSRGLLIRGGRLFKGGAYSRKYGNDRTQFAYVIWRVLVILNSISFRYSFIHLFSYMILNRIFLLD